MGLRRGSPYSPGRARAAIVASAAEEQTLFPVAAEATMPAGTLMLGAAYPNPIVVVASRATIAFELATAQVVRLTVYDVLGREVAVLADGALPAGEQTVHFDATGIQNGMYLVRLEVGDVQQTRPLTVALDETPKRARFLSRLAPGVLHSLTLFGACGGEGSSSPCPRFPTVAATGGSSDYVGEWGCLHRMRRSSRSNRPHERRGGSLQRVNVDWKWAFPVIFVNGGPPSPLTRRNG